jgi:hypothetical protein
MGRAAQVSSFVQFGSIIENQPAANGNALTARTAV